VIIITHNLEIITILDKTSYQNIIVTPKMTVLLTLMIPEMGEDASFHILRMTISLVLMGLRRRPRLLDCP